MIRAVVFDLDDTLMPETDYVKSGFSAVGRFLNDDTLADRLWQLFAENRTNVYQRAGFSEAECERCIEIYRSHMPQIILNDEVKGVLTRLRSQGLKLGIITDGRPTGQWNKIKALGLDKIMDKIIVTDELGGEQFRKPHPKSFELMREALGVEFDEMMYIGDNPSKDFYIGSVYPIVTVQIRNDGMYGDAYYYDGVFPDRVVMSLTEIKLF